MATMTRPRRFRLRSGHGVALRPLRRDDGPELVRMFEQLSEKSRYRRFFTVKPQLSDSTLAYLTEIDHHDHEALVALEPRTGRIVGVARFVRLTQTPTEADIAVTVVDSWQRRGLGTLLLEQLSDRASEEGIRYFTADILPENAPMLGLARRIGDGELSPPGGGTVEARLNVVPSEDSGSAPASNVLRAVARGDLGSLVGPFRFWLDLSEHLTRSLLIPVDTVRSLSRRKAS